MRARDVLIRLVPGLLGLLLVAACAAPGAPAKPAASGAAPASPPTASATAASQSTQAPALADAKLPAPTTVHFGYTPLLSGGPVFVGLERGYFEEMNINLDMVRFNSGALMIAPLANGDLDAGSGGTSPGLYNAFARDVRLKVVSDNGSSRAGNGTSIALVRKDLWDSGAIRSPQDLRGRRVSFATEGSPIDYMMRNLLDQNNMTMDDMDVQRLTSADAMVGLQNRAVDVATAAEPFPTQAEQMGVAVKWLNDGDVVPGYQISTIMYSEKFVAQPAAPRAFMVAYVRSVRDYLAADSGRADEGMREAISKWTTVPADLIAQSGAAYIRPNGRVDVDDMYKQQDFWIRHGVMKDRVDLTPFVDMSYVDYANQILGDR
ncbi:MAG TPA: ABC transporter substrate-binding protein [Chloroflexota bacterium]|nr:ABC transporter substrate-binding protein [Chloroflexota bacterium]